MKIIIGVRIYFILTSCLFVTFSFSQQLHLPNPISGNKYMYNYTNKYPPKLLWEPSPLMECDSATWNVSILPNTDVIGMQILESYDKGYLLCGWLGSNFPNYGWLIKTDINGNILWSKKTTLDGNNSIGINYVAQNQQGDIYIFGDANIYNNQFDPLILKLNSCGEKEWLKLFYTPDNNDLSYGLVASPDGGCTLLINSNGADIIGNVNRLRLIHLAVNGDMVWSNYLLNTDTVASNSEIFAMRLLPDSGYLLSGVIYYTSSTNPNLHWLHTYLIRTNSSGDLIWQKVINKESDNGGIGENCLFHPSSELIYALVTKNHAFPNNHNPALLKLSSQGDTISYAKFVTDTIGYMYEGVWGDNSTIISGVILDVGGPWFHSYLLKNDTLGNLLNIREIIDDEYPIHLIKSFDGKIICLLTEESSTNPGNFNVYLRKYNQNLEYDSLYNQSFTYDSLCGSMIASDTIFCNDPEIVGLDELLEISTKNLVIYPNPARGIIHLNFSDISLTTNYGHPFNSTLITNNVMDKSEGIIEIYNSLGQQVVLLKLNPNTNSLDLSVVNFKPGLYLVRWLSAKNQLSNGTFIVY